MSYRADEIQAMPSGNKVGGLPAELALPYFTEGHRA